MNNKVKKGKSLVYKPKKEVELFLIEQEGNQVAQFLFGGAGAKTGHSGVTVVGQIGIIRFGQDVVKILGGSHTGDASSGVSTDFVEGRANPSSGATEGVATHAGQSGKNLCAFVWVAARVIGRGLKSFNDFGLHRLVFNSIFATTCQSKTQTEQRQGRQPQKAGRPKSGYK